MVSSIFHSNIISSITDNWKRDNFVTKCYNIIVNQANIQSPINSENTQTFADFDGKKFCSCVGEKFGCFWKFFYWY